jgi:hypothetical protein
MAEAKQRLIRRTLNGQLACRTVAQLDEQYADRTVASGA